MRMKAIKYNFGRRMDLGSYNGVSASLTVEAEIEEGDNFDEVLAGIREMVQDNVFNAVGVWDPDRSVEAIAEETFCGLPVHLIDSNQIDPKEFVEDGLRESARQNGAKYPKSIIDKIEVEETESLEVNDAN